MTNEKAIALIAKARDMAAASYGGTSRTLRDLADALEASLTVPDGDEALSRVRAKLERIPDSDAVTLDKADVQELLSRAAVPDGDAREAVEEEATRRWGEFASTDTRQGAFERDAFVAGAMWALSRTAAPEPIEQYSYVEKWADGSGVYERITFGSASEAREWLRNRADGLAAFNAETDVAADRLVASIEKRETYSPGPWEPLPVGGEAGGE